MYEEKVDGWRMLAYKQGTDVRLVSRNGRDHTKRFPDLADEIRGLDVSALVLDGEVAVFDSKLMSRFRMAASATASRSIDAAHSTCAATCSRAYLRIPISCCPSGGSPTTA